MEHIPMPEIDYEKEQKAIKEAIATASKKSNSQILKKAVEGEKPEVHRNCQIARMLLNEGLEMYEAGTMSFGEFVEDLHKSLSVMVKK